MAFQGDSIFWVELDKVVPNPYQPRREFDEAKLKELAESIRMYGVLQPLTVTRRERTRDDGTFFTEYELIAGERRLRASKLASLAQVPVIIRQGEQTEQEKLELAIIENLQREDLNAVDRALAFQQLTEVFKLTHAQVAAKMGRSREYVSNTLRLLALPRYMLDSLQRAEISEGHARALLMLADRSEEQDVLFREILLKKISVRESERISRKIATDRVRKKEWKGSDPTLIEFERKLTETLGTRVQIKKTDFGGTVSIDYFDPEDLQKIIDSMAKKSAASVASGAASEIVIDALSKEKGEANEVISKLSLNTPLEEADDTDANPETEVSAPLPVVDDLVEPPALDTLVTPPTVMEDNPKAESTGAYEERFDSTKELLGKIADAKNEKDDSDMYSIKNFGV
ncbi:MAG: ParB/RepB/Spo0J family partition protein [Candidatus Paceibacterota bacterium]